MSLAKRIFFFVLINIGLIVSVSVLVFVLERFLGIRITPSLADGYTSLAIYSAVFGFSSAFISLAISRMMAKWMYSIELIKGERLMDHGPKVEIVYATVDRIARQNGITMPEVGVYDSPEPNAFATGPTKNRALVAVSTGLLESMTSAEIEGVVGHEMAHVLNGDMVTMTLLQGVLNTITIFISRILGNLIGNSVARSDSQAAFLVPIISIVLEIALGFAAMLVLMAFSRYREYRADEGGARMTGKAQMVAALRKLQTLQQRLTGQVETDDRLATMQISSYKASWFSSHPPLEDRISALESRYDLA
jgi:heat shock protein HtpX